MNKRRATAFNKHQGNAKRVLCVCTSGCLRSPTAAVVLSQEPFNYNTRAVGISKDYALIPVDSILLEWADEIVVFDSFAKMEIQEMLLDLDEADKHVTNLEIPDEYDYGDLDLRFAIAQNYSNMR